ncbi:hypothetical protein LTR57_023976 [Friedmanniomyces endolithicus]|nr:hypothetical protein LTR38_002116 [Friedmanniomyces endolithicus]KAK0873968.1 hypothetical protein LTS02_000349 [Friedmanniomyces endolithicus]KAK0893451.1 hypothetical protein LTR57_023976 [Friedmanniomyces endolithicus]
MHVQSFVNRPPASHAALVVVTLLPLYLASYRYRLWHPYGGTGSTAVDALSSATFVADWLDVHVIQPFHPSAIAAYCNRSEWHPNLVFTLVDGAEDGMAENVLDFPFYTTEAGASIVLPSFAAHGAGRAGGGITQENMPFRMLFDETWFLSSMTQARPQMAIYKPEQDHKMADALPGTYLPKSRKVDMDLRNTKKAFLEHLDVWLKEKPEFEPDQLTLVNVERTPWQVDTRNLPQEFRQLLPAAEIAVLKESIALQRALLDYEVLKRSSVFGGSPKRSSSYNIALTRNQWLVDQGRMNDPWFVVHEDVGAAFDDGVSRVVGRDRVFEQLIPRGMWP